MTINDVLCKVDGARGWQHHHDGLKQAHLIMALLLNDGSADTSPAAGPGFMSALLHKFLPVLEHNNRSDVAVQ